MTVQRCCFVYQIDIPAVLVMLLSFMYSFNRNLIKLSLFGEYHAVNQFCGNAQTEDKIIEGIGSSTVQGTSRSIHCICPRWCSLWRVIKSLSHPRGHAWAIRPHTNGHTCTCAANGHIRYVLPLCQPKYLGLFRKSVNSVARFQSYIW